MLTESLPQSPDEIDSDWLTWALSIRQPGTRVAGIEQVRIVNGASTKLCLRADYAENPHDLPATLWLKSGWETHSSFLQEAGTYVREAVWFDELSFPGIRAPRAFHGSWTSNGQAIVIMEDLHERGATLWECTVARPVSDVESMLDMLALLHARWWESAELRIMEHIGITMHSEGPSSVWARSNSGERLREVILGPRAEGLPDHVRQPERIEAAFWKMIASLEALEGGCLVHGDPHPGNCFSDKDGAAGLYDWQTIARGPWAFDVAYHIVTTLTPEDRRRSERSLLARYLAGLARNGVTSVPSDAEAWDEYRRHVAYAMLIWPTNHTTHQSEENIRALTLRTGLAAADLDLFSAWGV